MTTRPIRIVFFGTPSFSVPSLVALAEHSAFAVVGVVTQPDRLVGRKQEYLPSPVKTWALEHGLTVLQPAKLKDATVIEELKALQADVFVVVAYGRLIPDAIIAIPPKDTLNIHPSRLPVYRGPSPLQAAILNGDTETAVTLMLVRAEMDAGDILVQEPLTIHPEENIFHLSDRAAACAAELLIKQLPQWVAGNIEPQPQDPAAATSCTLIKREDGEINWSEPAETILRKARAFESWPGLYTVWNGTRLKLLAIQKATNTAPLAPGMVHVTEETLRIGTGSKPIEVLRLQREGKTPMETTTFLLGAPAMDGTQLPSQS